MRHNLIGHPLACGAVYEPIPPLELTWIMVESPMKTANYPFIGIRKNIQKSVY